MSSNNRLNRYKKPPVIRLPKTLKPTKSIVEQIDEDSDDDFKAPKRVASQAVEYRSTNSKAESRRKTKSSEDDVARCPSEPEPNASQCKYFSSNEMSIEKTNTAASSPYPDKREDSSSSSKSSKREKYEKKLRQVSCSKQTSILEHVLDTKVKIPESEQQDKENPVDDGNKVVCPFCWKKLSDKLSGTTHVKACAKNLPTNQIFEALQLQEKQIKEWEELGIAYPGFIGPAGGNGIAGGSKKGRGEAKRAPRPTRKKKQDPELELAIALSESLHEEVQRRKIKENELLVENGLEPEVATSVKQLEKPPKPINVNTGGSEVPVATINRNRRRGKKGSTNDLPLFTASEESKTRDLEKRLDHILDGNGTVEQVNYFVRNEPQLQKSVRSTRLKKLINKESSLWNISSSETAISTDFVTQAVVESKERNPETLQTIPRNCEKILERKAFSSKKNEDYPLSAKACVVRNSRPKKLSENRETTAATATSVKNKSFENIRESNSIEVSNPLMDPGSSATSSVLLKLASDLLSVLVKKQDTDLTIYGRDEKPIKCHQLIVKARCPKLMKETVIETSSTGRKRPIIPLTCYSHLAVKSFVKFMYCGQLSSRLPPHDKQDVEEMSLKYGLELKPHVDEITIGSGSGQPQKIDTETQTEQEEKPQLHATMARSRDILLKSECDRSRSRARGSLDMFAEASQEQLVNEIHAVPVPSSSGLSQQENLLSEDEDLFAEFETEELGKLEAGGVEEENRELLKEIGSADCEVSALSVNQNEMSVILEENDGSRDLFEDEYNDDFAHEKVETVIEVNSTATINDEPDYAAHLKDLKSTLKTPQSPPSSQDSDNGILEDELCTQPGPRILLSPKPYSKRSRSVSPATPLHLGSSQQYTATQMANYLEMKEDGLIPDSPVIQQANKKHKLDVKSVLIESSKGNDDVFCFPSCGRSVSLSRKSSPVLSMCSNLINESTEGVKNFQSTPITNFCISPDPSAKLDRYQSNFTPRSSRSRSASRSTSSGKLIEREHFPFMNDNSSPSIPPEQNAEYNDPFDGVDDSCFVNIPSILLERSIVSSKPTPNLPASPFLPHQCNLKTNIQTVHSNNDLSDNFDGPSQRHSRQVSKSKPKSKRKSLSQSRVPVTSNFQQLNSSSPIQHGPTSGGGSKTPLLNYSTIDTPILKKELKRYGLKPLPRSKAKKILRHIYHETHK